MASFLNEILWLNLLHTIFPMHKALHFSNNCMLSSILSFTWNDNESKRDDWLSLSIISVMYSEKELLIFLETNIDCFNAKVQNTKEGFCA